MRISTKGRYAIKLMLDLATNDNGEPIRLKDVARRQEISEKYLEQIISVLVRAEYLRSIRGPQGGYRLTKKPEDYKVGMILRLTEGSLAPVDCLTGDDNPCARQQECVTLKLWKELDGAIRDVVDGYTLDDLVQWQRAMQDNYVI